MGVQISEISPELADAADVLSDQLRAHLQRLAVILLPHADMLERRFLRKLELRRFEPRVRSALVALTSGAAARILGKGFPAVKFIEQVEYNGRRLAKLNLPPSSIVEALQEYDRLLAPTLRKLPPSEYANFQWVREQLNFCVILTLNNAYYQVREAESQAFYELFRVELESRNLDELLRRFLQTLVQVCNADAGNLYLLNDEGTAWILRSSALVKQGGVPALTQVRNRPRIMQHLSKAQQVNPGAENRNLLLDPDWKGKYKSFWSIPLVANGRTAGVMQFGFSRAYEWLPREQDSFGGRRTLSDGGGEGAPDGRLGGSRGTDPPTGRAHVARRRDGAPAHQSRTA